jgi:hypothetical protein
MRIVFAMAMMQGMWRRLRRGVLGILHSLPQCILCLDVSIGFVRLLNQKMSLDLKKTNLFFVTSHGTIITIRISKFILAPGKYPKHVEFVTDTPINIISAVACAILPPKTAFKET